MALNDLLYGLQGSTGEAEATGWMALDPPLFQRPSVHC